MRRGIVSKAEHSSAVKARSIYCVSECLCRLSDFGCHAEQCCHAPPVRTARKRRYRSLRLCVTVLEIVPCT
jgi:hypothetical protein